MVVQKQNVFFCDFLPLSIVGIFLLKENRRFPNVQSSKRAKTVFVFLFFTKSEANEDVGTELKLIRLLC